MTVVFEAPGAAAVPTAVHVLAIGVGNYPHLLGGSGTLTNRPLDLGQLSSPPVSLKAVVDWFLAPQLDATRVGFVNPGAVLGSVDALASAPAPVQITTPAGVMALEGATRDRIQLAFERWLARLKGPGESIGVFYFCGHGVMAADHYLLADDFGRSNGAPWAHAFDVSNSLRGVERETQGALYFFIDACREISTEVALTLGANPLALWAADLKRPVIRNSTTLIEATGEGKLAFGLDGRVSRFTDALITAMSGYCGVKGPGAATWDVDGETLANAVRKLLEGGNKTAKRRQISGQSISGVSVPLLRHPRAPLVKVSLDLLPEPMRVVARLYLESSRGERRVHEGAKGPYLTEVPRGMYTIGAEAMAAQFESLSFDEDLIPPVHDLPMRVGP